MKRIFLFTAMVLSLAFFSCEEEKNEDKIPDSFPRTGVPEELRGSWMYGRFSFTEYWSQNPATYLDNALSFAMAFRFFQDGTYEQYFTARVVNSGSNTYQQSITKGTVEIDPDTKTIKTHPYKSRYKRTSYGMTEEEKDMPQSELISSTYTYTTGIEPNGTKAIYLKLEGTTQPFTFLNKP